MAEPNLEKSARAAAAKAAGIREDEVETAVRAYRAALSSLHDEPQWQAVLHMSFGYGGGVHQYAADGTDVTLEICNHGKGKSERIYVLKGQVYETLAEARAVEVEQSASFMVREVSDGL